MVFWLVCKSGWGSGALLCNNYPRLSSVPTELRAVLVDVASLCSGNILSTCEGRPWHTGEPYHLRDCIFLELRELQQGVFPWCCMHYVGPYSSAWQRSWIDLHDCVLAISSVTFVSELVKVSLSLNTAFLPIVLSRIHLNLPIKLTWFGHLPDGQMGGTLSCSLQSDPRGYTSYCKHSDDWSLLSLWWSSQGSQRLQWLPPCDVDVIAHAYWASDFLLPSGVRCHSTPLFLWGYSHFWLNETLQHKYNLHPLPVF